MVELTVDQVVDRTLVPVMQLPVVRPIPQRALIARLLDEDVHIVGGFPLWLAGGANFYSDIDCYPASWDAYYRWHKRFRDLGPIVQHTPETTVFRYRAETLQLVKPVPHQSTVMGILSTVDLSPCACALLSTADGYSVATLHPDDIRDRVCRILIEHDWTPYRADVYQRKGYEIVPSARPDPVNIAP